jgi:hypothetical protein
MMRCRRLFVTLAFVVCSLSNTALAIPKNWKSLVPFTKRIEADPNKRYDLKQVDGPWMILAASFAGANGEKQANQLMLELRRELNRPVYTHMRVFDFTAPVRGVGIDRYARPRQMKYRQDTRIEEVAVLVGDYDSAESSDIQKTLKKIKIIWPSSLDYRGKKETTQRFVGLRMFQRKISGDDERQSKGPMGNAFVTRNPLLPEDYFVPKGVDSFVVKLNRRNPFNLLENPARYTVQIATFQGKSSMNLTDADQIGINTAALDFAAEKADKIAAELRHKGVQAWVLHDRFESVVTVGGFRSLGTPRQDGKIEISPAVHRVIEMFKARQRQVRGAYAIGVHPVVVAGIACDVQPTLIVVPRQSATSEFTWGHSLFR